MSDAEQIIARIQALCDKAKPAIQGMPLECTNACMDDLCNCGGKMRTLGWTLDPDEVRAALTKEQPCGDCGLQLEPEDPPGYDRSWRP